MPIIYTPDETGPFLKSTSDPGDTIPLTSNLFFSMHAPIFCFDYLKRNPDYFYHIYQALRVESGMKIEGAQWSANYFHPNDDRVYSACGTIDGYKNQIYSCRVEIPKGSLVLQFIGKAADSGATKTAPDIEDSEKSWFVITPSQPGRASLNRCDYDEENKELRKSVYFNHYANLVLSSVKEFKDPKQTQAHLADIQKMQELGLGRN